jgi:signal transduction histidine kinase
VDLLQKPHTEAQRAEYLAVLDRQAKRLKKLTEDLVEASKASTGNIPADILPTNLGELLEQAVAEYGSRLEQARLQPVLTLPEDSLSALADGRLLWRVLDNLLGNVCKYALPDTRVYIALDREGDKARIQVKNISREELNISADELTERFVRGDRARLTEGSGLGLNIARSLVELQRGGFELEIDGDLFKAVISLPLAASAREE